ncbi:MAG: hypothetical protein OQK12_10475 [Motiliproteus sp.]|nr:hypothetical protein [Motiliproteus sp.]MCW9050933.1 hypothetical protein [Motiliproteus sp.]
MSAASVIPASVLSLVLLAPSLQAMNTADVVSQGAVKESRYVLHRVGATSKQMDVMQTVVRTTIPGQIKTVGTALEYLLKPYGYQLDDEGDETTQLDFYVLLTRPLPEPHRTIDPMTLTDVLNVLGGESFEVVINPVLRTVHYRLKPGLQNYVSETDREKAQAIWSESIEPEPDITQKAPLPMTVFGYGPVKPGDTLSDIVLLFDMTDFTLDQVLVHAFRANPDAFANGNMNHLIVGAYLSIPPLNSDSLPPIEASRLVDEHYHLWLQQVQR